MTLIHQTDQGGHLPATEASSESESTESRFEDARPHESLEAGVIGLQDELRPSSNTQRMYLPFLLPFHYPLSPLLGIL